MTTRRVKNAFSVYLPLFFVLLANILRRLPTKFVLSLIPHRSLVGLQRHSVSAWVCECLKILMPIVMLCFLCFLFAFIVHFHAIADSVVWPHTTPTSGNYEKQKHSRAKNKIDFHGFCWRALCGWAANCRTNERSIEIRGLIRT